MGSCKLLLHRCEPTSEERSAGNLHAAFCGSRGRATSPATRWQRAIAVPTATGPTLPGSVGYSERVSLLGAESTRKTASGLPPARLLGKGLRYEPARQLGSRWPVRGASATPRDGIARSRIPIRSHCFAQSRVLGRNPCNLPCSDRRCRLPRRRGKLPSPLRGPRKPETDAGLSDTSRYPGPDDR